jgi:iron complex outermembrane receptor protein
MWTSVRSTRSACRPATPSTSTPRSRSTDGEVGTRFLSNGTEARLELVQKERDGWQGAVGFQALKRHFSAIGDEAFVPSTDIKEYGVFTLQRLDKGDWGIDAGLRFDSRELKTAFADKTFDNVSGSLGLFYKPAEHQFVALSLSRNGRAPTEFELFADGPHPGTGGYEVGDASLKSEKVTSLEATYRYTGERLRVEGHLWGAHYNGFIEEAQTGAIEDGLPVFEYFQTGAKFHGAELETSYVAWREGKRSLKLEGVYDFVRGETDLGVPARVPPWAVTGRVVWSAPRLDIKAEVRRVAARIAWPPSNCRPTATPRSTPSRPSSRSRTRRCACSSMVGI